MKFPINWIIIAQMDQVWNLLLSGQSKLISIMKKYVDHQRKCIPLVIPRRDGGHLVARSACTDWLQWTMRGDSGPQRINL